MEKLNGVFAYEVDESVFAGMEGCEMHAISQDPEVYRNYPDKEDVNFLVCRQGIVNDVLKYYPNVRWLQLLNAGFERVDLDELKRRNIVFTNARSVYCATIAEDVIAKILFLARNYLRHIDDQKKCFWPDDYQLPNYNLDLCGRTLGILGSGAIGHEIAVRAKAFGMIVKGYAHHARPIEGFDDVYSGEDGLKKILAESDFVITSLPVTDETRDIINEHTLAMMKSTAYLINVARGEIVDEDALVKALNNHVIAGAALDVTKHEPLAENDPLWTAENILITPHRAAYGDQMKNKMCALICRNIDHWLNDEKLEDRKL